MCDCIIKKYATIETDIGEIGDVEMLFMCCLKRNSEHCSRNWLVKELGCYPMLFGIGFDEPFQRKGFGTKVAKMVRRKFGKFIGEANTISAQAFWHSIKNVRFYNNIQFVYE